MNTVHSDIQCYGMDNIFKINCTVLLVDMPLSFKLVGLIFVYFHFIFFFFLGGGYTEKTFPTTVDSLINISLLV